MNHLKQFLSLSAVIAITCGIQLISDFYFGGSEPFETIMADPLVVGGALALGGALGGIGAGRRARRGAAKQFRAINSKTNKQFRKDKKYLAGEMRGMRQLDSTLSGQLNDSLNSSVLGTAEGQGMTRAISNQSNNARDRLGQDANLMGLSDEAYVAGLGNINENEGEAITGSISSLMGAKRSREMTLTGMRQGMLGQMVNTKQGILQGARGYVGGTYGGALTNSTAQQQSNTNAVSNAFATAGKLYAA